MSIEWLNFLCGVLAVLFTVWFGWSISRIPLPKETAGVDERWLVVMDECGEWSRQKSFDKPEQEGILQSGMDALTTAAQSSAPPSDGVDWWLPVYFVLLFGVAFFSVHTSDHATERAEASRVVLMLRTKQRGETLSQETLETIAKAVIKAYAATPTTTQEDSLNIHDKCENIHSSSQGNHDEHDDKNT